ncbi:biogenesis of lysosome-related organelles complex 1 subunit 5-like [Ptychodera flava]|uniref:biogenesis of lysosome-related organelles complex 1 subunit 5-like n=1 Tax=Ptychodera flava TaxID=63121 RepID=UPI00396A8103
MVENIIKDAGQIHSRLLDHRPILQGELKFFVKEFETRRNDREYDRLKKILNQLTDTNERFIPENVALMEEQLPDIKEKLNGANRMCARILVREEQRKANDPLKKKKEERQKQWSEFTKKQGDKSSAVDKEHEQKMKEIKELYEEMNKTLIRNTQT